MTTVADGSASAPRVAAIAPPASARRKPRPGRITAPTRPLPATAARNPYGSPRRWFASAPATARRVTALRDKARRVTALRDRARRVTARRDKARRLHGAAVAAGRHTAVPEAAVTAAAGKHFLLSPWLASVSSHWPGPFQRGPGVFFGCGRAGPMRGLIGGLGVGLLITGHYGPSPAEAGRPIRCRRNDASSCRLAVYWPAT
jgi:hypothetical protein